LFVNNDSSDCPVTEFKLFSDALGSQEYSNTDFVTFEGVSDSFEIKIQPKKVPDITVDT